jgi:hypothetical protein
MLFLGREREKGGEGLKAKELEENVVSASSSSFVFLFFQSDILGLRFP